MRVQYIFLLFWLISCNNQTVDKEPSRPLLYKITANSKTIYSFDYDENKRLITEIQYLTCDTPFKKIMYHYSSDRLDSVSRDEKQLTNYSISPPFLLVEQCENAIYKQFREVLEYNREGKLIKVIDDEYVKEYSYNSPNKIEAVTTFRNAPIKSLKYDHNGNLIEEQNLDTIATARPIGDFFRNITLQDISPTSKYEYDIMRNPKYSKEIWPYEGPNNIVKRNREDNTLMFKSDYIYNEQGYPLERTGSDGSKWIYHYR